MQATNTAMELCGGGWEKVTSRYISVPVWGLLESCGGLPWPRTELSEFRGLRT